MAEPPITEPAEAPLPPLSARRRRAAAPSSTVTLARLSSLTGILFAALFVLALVFVYTTPHLSALHPVVVLVFPTWVVVAGLVVFIRAGRVAEPAASERQST